MLTMQDIQAKAPSVFARGAWDGTSDKYRFFPTDYVVQALMNNGFSCSSARQARTRIEGKEEFTKHILRFRHDSLKTKEMVVGDTFPEIILSNSHDGTSSYAIGLGMFRLACSNGLCVKSGDISEIRVRHSGRDGLIDEVIEGSFKVISEAPKVIEQVREWQGIQLEAPEQRILAEAALDIRGTSLEVRADELLRARRSDDKGDGSTRDLWKTMNVVQEHIIRGGAYGRTPVRIEEGRSVGGQLRRMNALKSVVEDTKFNRALWEMTEKMAQLKTKAAA